MNNLFRDTGLMFGRTFSATLRNPIWIFIGLFQPVLYMLLFMPLLYGIEANPLQSFTPGLLVMTALYTVAGAGYGIISDLRSGLIERFRVTPVNRLAFMLGYIFNNGLSLLAQFLLLIGIGFLMGMRVPLPGLLGALLLGLLVGIGMAALAYGLGLGVKDENGLASITNTFLLPVLLLSGVLLPFDNAHPVLKALALANPFSHIVNAARALFAGQYAQTSVFVGFGLALVLVVLCTAWSARMFKEATA